MFSLRCYKPIGRLAFVWQVLFNGEVVGCGDALSESDGYKLANESAAGLAVFHCYK